MSFILEISGELACFTRPELKKHPNGDIVEAGNPMASLENRNPKTDPVDEYPPQRSGN